MEQSQLDKTRVSIRVSSSIANFRDKLQGYLKLPTWKWSNQLDNAVFFGLYHWKDYSRFLWHWGKKKVFWCGSDILQLKQTNKFWRNLIVNETFTKHYCENEIEQFVLASMGIEAKVCPLLLDDPDKYVVDFKPSNEINVYSSCHPGREMEYGIHIIHDLALVFPQITFHIYGSFAESVLPNEIWHGIVPSEQFDLETSQYQIAMRLTQFDGFSEILAKAVLRGQGTISTIQYPYINYAQHLKDINQFLKEYDNKPNFESSNYWRKTLKENINELIDNWSW